MRIILPLVLAGGCLSAGDPGNLVPRTVDDDPSLPAITLAGTRFHAEAFGDPGAPLLITLHGGPGADYRSMLPLAALADDGYRVVFWDQRGTGLSARQDAASYGADTYPEDLRLLIDHYTTSPDQPVWFIGHSWGAMYATQFISLHGDDGGRIRGAVLTEPGAFNERQLDAFIKKLQGSVDLFGEQFNDALWADQLMSASDHERADYLAAVMALEGVPSEHHDPDHPTPMWRMGAVVSSRLLAIARETHFDFTTNLSAFTHPVLFLRGELNDAATLEQQQELASSYPDATIQTIAGAGHEVQWDHADEYLADVRAYLRAIDVPGVAR